MASIGKYGQVNAKVRAMRSNLLSKAIFHKLIDSRSIKEFISYFAATRFAESCNLNNQDPISLEYCITLENVHQWKHLKKNCPQEIAEIINYFIEEYELRKLKHILRLWHQKKQLDTPLLHEKIRYALPASDILQSENIHQVIENLADTPYQSILVNKLSQYDEMNSVFPFEVSLDKDYYSRLWDLTDSFDKGDGEISKKILGIEIDLINLSWLTRFEDYYNISSDPLSAYLISKGNDNKMSLIQSFDKTDTAPQILGKIVGEKRVKQLGDLDYANKITFFEKALTSIMLSQARKAFMGFPFTISIVWGFRVFLKFEAKNLFSVIQSKAYELNKDEVLPYLVF